MPWPRAPRVRLASAQVLAAPLAANVLAAIQFGGDLADVDPRRIQVPLPVAPNSGDAGEIWYVDDAVNTRSDAGCSRTIGGGMAALRVHVHEAALEAGLEAAVADAYSRVLSGLRESGFPYPLRIWNYLSAINEGEHDAERYRRFCVGRGRALLRNTQLERLLPAATAIGSAPGNGLLVFALAACQPGLQIENPKQVSAFRYPRDYGRQSPSFSRATRVPWADQTTLFISGTASIVGHRTVHVGDVSAQLHQTVANIHTLCEQAARLDAGSFALRSCTVYARKAADLARLQPELADLFGGLSPRLCIGEVCRRDLDIEIEATCILPKPGTEPGSG